MPGNSVRLPAGELIEIRGELALIKFVRDGEIYKVEVPAVLVLKTEKMFAPVVVGVSENEEPHWASRERWSGDA